MAPETTAAGLRAQVRAELRAASNGFLDNLRAALLERLDTITDADAAARTREVLDDTEAERARRTGERGEV